MYCINRRVILFRYIFISIMEKPSNNRNDKKEASAEEQSPMKRIRLATMEEEKDEKMSGSCKKNPIVVEEVEVIDEDSDDDCLIIEVRSKVIEQEEFDLNMDVPQVFVDDTAENGGTIASPSYINEDKAESSKVAEVGDEARKDNNDGYLSA